MRPSNRWIGLKANLFLQSEEIIAKIRRECNGPIAPEAVEFEELIYSFTRQASLKIFSFKVFYIYEFITSLT